MKHAAITIGFAVLGLALVAGGFFALPALAGTHPGQGAPVNSAGCGADQQQACASGDQDNMSPEMQQMHNAGGCTDGNMSDHMGSAGGAGDMSGADHMSDGHMQGGMMGGYRATGGMRTV